MAAVIRDPLAWPTDSAMAVAIEIVDVHALVRWTSPMTGKWFRRGRARSPRRHCYFSMGSVAE